MANNYEVLDSTETAVVFKSTDTAGVHTTHHNIDLSVLPTGASTAANQATEITHLSQIETAVETSVGHLAAIETAVESTDPVEVVTAGNEYETVAASQTTQSLGATGATGDLLELVICVVSTAATSQVQIKDGAGSAITILPNNVGGGIGTYVIPLGLRSAAGAWQITTAAGVAVIATGDFT